MTPAKVEKGKNLTETGQWVDPAQGTRVKGDGTFLPQWGEKKGGCIQKKKKKKGGEKQKQATPTGEPRRGGQTLSGSVKRLGRVVPKKRTSMEEGGTRLNLEKPGEKGPWGGPNGPVTRKGDPKNRQDCCVWQKTTQKNTKKTIWCPRRRGKKSNSGLAGKGPRCDLTANRRTSV